MAIKKKIYLTILVVLFVFLVLGVFIFLLLQEIKSSSQELINKKRALVVLEAKIVNLEKFKDVSNELNDFLKKIDNLFIDAKAPVAFIDFLEKTAQKSRLEIEITPLSNEVVKEAKDFWPSLSFRVMATGSFTDFLEFLTKIENSPYLVDIQTITLSQVIVEKQVVSGQIKANLLVKVFVK